MQKLQSFEPTVKTINEESGHYVELHHNSNYSCWPSPDDN